MCFHMCFYVSFWVCMSVCDCVCACTCVCLPVSLCTCGSITWGGPQRERLTAPWLSARSRLMTLVSSWALPCGGSGPPRQTSPRCRSLSGCREKERGEHHEDSNTRNYLRAVLTQPSEALLWSPFTDAEIEAQRDWVPDSGLSPSNECHWRGWNLSNLALTTSLLKRAWSPPVAWVLTDTLRGTMLEGSSTPPCFACHFSERPRPQGGKDSGSGSTRFGFTCLWPMLSMKPCTQQGPTFALPALRFLVCFEQGVPHVYFALTPWKFCHWSWAPGELLVEGNILTIFHLSSISNPPANRVTCFSNPFPDTSYCSSSSLSPSGPNCSPWAHEHSCVPKKFSWQKQVMGPGGSLGQHFSLHRLSLRNILDQVVYNFSCSWKNLTVNLETWLVQLRLMCSSRRQREAQKWLLVSSGCLRWGRFLW